MISIDEYMCIGIADTVAKLHQGYVCVLLLQDRKYLHALADDFRRYIPAPVRLCVYYVLHE